MTSILTLTTQACTGAGDPIANGIFTSTVAYDTLLIVGTSGEKNPLFLYRDPLPFLLDSGVVVYSDGADRGRIVVAHLFSGDGWETRSGIGEDGPGQFGGMRPHLFPFRGAIHALTPNRVYNSWNKEGALLDSRRYGGSWFREDEWGWPVGFADGMVVVRYNGMVTAVAEETVRLPQGVRIFEPGGELVAEIGDGTPELVMENLGGSDGRARFSSTSGDGLLVSGRGETIVMGMYGEKRITSFDPHGRVIAQRDLAEPIVGLRIDADERIWANTLVRDASGTLGIIVMSRSLHELRRVAAHYVFDATGDFILAVKPGPLGERALVLLKARPLPPRSDGVTNR